MGPSASTCTCNLNYVCTVLQYWLNLYSLKESVSALVTLHLLNSTYFLWRKLITGPELCNKLVFEEF